MRSKRFGIRMTGVLLTSALAMSGAVVPANAAEYTPFDGDPRHVMGTYCRVDGKCITINRDPYGGGSARMLPTVLDASGLGSQNPIPSGATTARMSLARFDVPDESEAEQYLRMNTDFTYRMRCSSGNTGCDGHTVHDGQGVVGVTIIPVLPPLGVTWVSKNNTKPLPYDWHVNASNPPTRRDYVVLQPYRSTAEVSAKTVFYRKGERKIWFHDVQPETPHSTETQWLADNGISTGWKISYNRYMFYGMRAVTRQDMAAFLRREAKNRNIADARTWKPSAADWKRFRDVNGNTPHAEDILWLAHAGISTGWKEQDGRSTFRGMNPVIRQDMAAFLKRLADRSGKWFGAKPVAGFTDVTDATPHASDIQWLAGTGISQGYRNANGTLSFRGTTAVYRQDMSAFLYRFDEWLR